ncbi:MAG: LysR family transcriptional regulator [Desulfovibrio sp.]|uniref:LysR family transcriptional regulator n=1 Tax=Desulfovibrio sp. TaxID=885 RepID=UPI0039E3C3E0
MNPNWDDIRFFLSVSRTSSFVAAAQQLHVTHCTVSRRISALEAALGAELFIRTERGCLATHAGEKLLPIAEELERAALKFQDCVSHADGQVSGKIRIGCPDGLGNCFLAQKLKLLQTQNPLLEVELVSVPFYYSLSKREVDIIITVKKPGAKKIVSENITDYKLGLFASAHYINTSCAIKELSDLKQHKLIGYIDDLLYDQELRFIEEIYPSAQTGFRSSTVLGQMSAIKAGIGIGVLPFFMAREEAELVPVLPERWIERKFWIQADAESKKISRVKKTMDFIVSAIRSNKSIFTSPIC